MYFPIVLLQIVKRTTLHKIVDDDDNAEEQYRHCVDGLANMREEAANDVLMRPEI